MSLSEYGVILKEEEWINQEESTSASISFIGCEMDKDDCYFMDSSMIRNVQALDKVYNEMEKLYNEKNESSEDELGSNIFGRLVAQYNDDEGENQFFLRKSSSYKGKIRLDFSESSDFSIFPGQFVEVKGSFSKNDVFKVREIFAPKSLIRPFPCYDITFGPVLNIVTAAGPFNKNNDVDCPLLNCLLEYVSTCKPHLFLIMGPILNVTEEMFDHDLSQTFREIMTSISDCVKNTITWVYVISSPEEWDHLNVFPTPPYEDPAKHYQRITFAPNPCIMNVSGVVVGATSIDIPFHLSRNMVESVRHQDESGTRFNRICNHILSQHSFYPLYPPDKDLCLEVVKMDNIRFSMTPHIMIVPSVFRNFIKCVDGCIFINPEKLRKGLMGRIQVKPPQEDSKSLAGAIIAQVIRIKDTLSAQTNL